MKNSRKQLKDLVGKTPVRKINLPEAETINDVYTREGKEGLKRLLDQSDELEEVTEVDQVPLPISMQDIEKPQLQLPLDDEEDRKALNSLYAGEDEQKTTLHIQVLHEHKLYYKGQLNNYYILGSIGQDLSGLQVMLIVEDPETLKKERMKLDLYEREYVHHFAMEIAEQFNQNSDIVLSELNALTDELELYREQQLEQARPQLNSKRAIPSLSIDNQKRCLEFLKQKDLISQMDQLIERSGVVGEENTRKLLFIIASTYKMGYPLHALVQGSSGSGKSHLINIIGQCLPPEDVLSMTRVTSKSFYHYGKDELVDKLILIQDYDGLDEEAQYAFRELQSAGSVSSSTTYKDKYGNIMSMVKTVRSHFASLLATTKAEVYHDNMSRSVVLGVDESEEQTIRIIQYQNKKLAGLIDQKEEQAAKIFLQNCLRCIKPYEVVNRYADQVKLPMEAKMLRRLNSHYQAFVKQITILYQHQRKKDQQGRLIAEPQDLQMACDILFDAIMLKVDDLDSSLRQFFDKMKAFIKERNTGQPDSGFTQREVRLALNVSKTQCFRYMEDLELLEYVQRTGGYSNRGFRYKIVFWDDMQKIREKVKTELGQQLQQLKQTG